MKEKDMTDKAFLAYEDVFADIINTTYVNEFFLRMLQLIKGRKEKRGSVNRGGRLADGEISKYQSNFRLEESVLH